MRFVLVIFLAIFVFTSCKNDKKEIDISNINADFTVKRFDVDFYKTTKNTLQETKKKYPILFPNHTPDSIWLQKINDKEEQELFVETQKIFKDFSDVEQQLKSLFKHVKYYNSNFKEPNIITLLTNIDYKNRVIYADSLLLISLDAYLGKEHFFYTDYPDYIKQNNTKNHLPVDVAEAIINTQVKKRFGRDFISKIIFEGKKLYLLNAYLPKFSKTEKLGFTKEKLQWAINNEEEIWKYFIENDLLYSTNKDLDKRFLEIAPFSKFYMADDNLSPGKIGAWVGWQIVTSFMNKNNVDLQKMIETPEQEIFKRSNYKPKR